MRFENTDELKGAEFLNVDLAGARFQNVNLTGARLKEAMLVNARMSGLIHGLVINDIEVAPLITAEMERRYPERKKLVPSDADGVREAWSIVESIWTPTMQRARELPEALLHERVDGEWSFLETVRHLVMVIDAWISGNVLGQTDQFHPLGVAPSFIVDPAAMGIDIDADPSLEEVVRVREERMDVVRGLVADVTDADLERQCGEHTVLRCLLTLFDEEWAHHWYATRDLDTLEQRRS
jgi:uncharacterized protein YjbI with pentapeptide repeats